MDPRCPSAGGLRAGALVALLAAIGGGAGISQPAGAQVPAAEITLEDDTGNGGQLGVDARGGAVAAWWEYTRRLDRAIAVSVRPAGGAFGTQRRISTGPATGRLALAVGAGGDAAVVWEQMRPRSGTNVLMATRARPGQRFGTPVAVPSPARTAQLAAAIDARGTLLVAWLQASGRQGCGRVVLASVAPPGGRFGAARRVSAACPNAALMDVALARSGAGAIAWRSGRNLESDSTRFEVQASTYAGGRFAAPRTLSRGRVWYGQPALAAGGNRALVAWRASTPTARAQATRGRVLVATIDGSQIGKPVAVSTTDVIEGDVHAAMNDADAGILSWVQRASGDAGRRVAIRPAAAATFGRPEPISPCPSLGNQLSGSGREALDRAARVALDGAGRALAIYPNGCGGGLGAARRPASDGWQPQFTVSSRPEEARPVFVGVSDTGEGVVAWSTPQDRTVDSAALRAVVLPAPASG